MLIPIAAVACLLWMSLPHAAFATGAESATDLQVDPAPCVAAAAAGDADKIIAICGALIANEKTQRADRIKALIARAGAYDRKDQIDRAIGDYDTVLRLDPTLADIFNVRGELWRRKGDRPRALADFGAAIKLNPNHPGARDNYRSLAQELERLGALMAVYNKPSFNCATARRPVQKAICANPELANLDREINAVNAKVVGAADFRQSARRSRPAARAGRVHRPPRCRLRQAGLRPAKGDAGAAGPSAGGRAVLGAFPAALALEMVPLQVTMVPRKSAWN